MYPVRSPPGIQSEMCWRGLVVTPRRGTMFGCFKCFHVTAIWWKFCGFASTGEHGNVAMSVTHLLGHSRVPPRVYASDTYL